MKTFCSIKDGTCIAVGDLTHVIQKTFNWFLDDKRVLTVRVSGHKPIKFHSFSEKWSKEEIATDVNSFLIVKAKDFGIGIFRECD